MDVQDMTFTKPEAVLTCGCGGEIGLYTSHATGMWTLDVCHRGAYLVRMLIEDDLPAKQLARQTLLTATNQMAYYKTSGKSCFKALYLYCSLEWLM
jgi:hypothetical protein